MYGLPAITINQPIRNDLVPWESENTNELLNKDAIGWSVNGNDDRSVAFAARLMEQNITSEVVTVVEEGIAYDTETFSESKSFGTGDHNVNIPPTGSNVRFTIGGAGGGNGGSCLLYTSPSPRDLRGGRMPSWG